MWKVGGGAMARFNAPRDFHVSLQWPNYDSVVCLFTIA